MAGPHDSQVATLVQPNASATPLEGSFVITVSEGPDKGATFTLDDTHASRVLVGQSPACDLRLTDREVSRRHLSLEMTDRGIRVVDLGSTNGTFVDRVKIHEAELLGGEMVRVGSSVLTIEHESTAAAPRLTNASRFGKILGA